LGKIRTYTQDDQLCRQDECQPLKLEIYSENANDENVMTASWSRQMLQDIHNRVSRLLYLMRCTLACIIFPRQLGSQAECGVTGLVTEERFREVIAELTAALGGVTLVTKPA
jgi:hypothetical protein